MRNLLTAITLAATLVGSAAHAQTNDQTPPDRIATMFTKADQNKDGVLTLDEWKAAGRRERGFRMIDSNHDDKVTLDELRAAVTAYKARN